MSFDDYANHIYQKHRLATALALIKSKPKNMNTQNYLKELKSNIEHKMDEDHVTVCSDDFLMEDDELNDSVNILKDFDPEFVNNDEILLGDDNMDSEKEHAIPENLSQITYFNSFQSQPHENITQTQNKHNLNQINIVPTPKNAVSKEFKDEVENIDKNISVDNKPSNSKAITDKETQDLINKPIINESMDVTYYDSQKTVIYTVPQFTQNYTHYSPSQDDIVIPNKYLHGLNNNKNLNTGPNEDICRDNATVAENMHGIDNETQFNSKGNSLSSKMVERQANREEFESIPTMNVISQKNNNNFDEILNVNTHLDSKTKRSIEDIDVIINKDKETDNIENSNRHSQNINEYFNEIQMIRDNDIGNRLSGENNINLQVSEAVQDIQQINDEPYSYTTNISKEYRNSNNENNKTIDINQFAKATITKNNHQLSTNDTSTPKVRREEYKITEEEYDTHEIISYKLLEEFNKVKSFLNRHRGMSCDGYSTDSGYRSDTQIRSSHRSALQLSGNWLNQSGCCLFNYVMQCPLVASTRDITGEIAQILGQLIDRLHEEEKYPSFLEDMLETVNILLRQVYEGDSSEDGEFLKKDATIQRILLLNKSIHIQKHSIEIITKILETFHSNITETEPTLELTNINLIENVAYIFHILEILLKRYLKGQEVLSQTQASQEEEKILNKSSITMIWKKKWNPSQDIFEGTRDKKCILKFCSEILNRIVVDCVRCYSLVAYSALKCFNSMQT